MHIMKKQVLLIILLALPLWLKAADVSVTGLRTEQMVDPMGLDTAAPRMSWRLESSQRNVMQTAYRILVASSPELLAQDKGDLWDSGKVESDASVWIPYQGKRLKSNQRVYWKVRSYTNRGETEWSEPARWGAAANTDPRRDVRTEGAALVIDHAKASRPPVCFAFAVAKVLPFPFPTKLFSIFFCPFFQLFYNHQFINEL